MEAGLAILSERREGKLASVRLVLAACRAMLLPLEVRR
jgi:hypothetical protein